VAGSREEFGAGHGGRFQVDPALRGHDGHGFHGHFDGHRFCHNGWWGARCWNCGCFPAFCAGWFIPFFPFWGWGWGYDYYPAVVIYDDDDGYSGSSSAHRRVPELPPGVDAAEFKRFDSAREAFFNEEWGKAQYRIEEIIQKWPDDPVLREFHALVLFARRNYDGAAAELATALKSGPGWNYDTLRSLYPDTEVYTKQLRTLEDYVRANPDAAAGHFVLAYHYICLDERAAAISQLETVLRLQPANEVADRLLKMLQAEQQTTPPPKEETPPTAPGTPPPAPPGGE
jgi:hypothetical protein